MSSSPPTIALHALQAYKTHALRKTKEDDRLFGVMGAYSYFHQMRTYVSFLPRASGKTYAISAPARANDVIIAPTHERLRRLKCAELYPAPVAKLQLSASSTSADAFRFDLFPIRDADSVILWFDDFSQMEAHEWIDRRIPILHRLKSYNSGQLAMIIATSAS